MGGGSLTPFFFCENLLVRVKLGLYSLHRIMTDNSIFNPIFRDSPAIIKDNMKISFVSYLERHMLLLFKDNAKFSLETINRDIN